MVQHIMTKDLQTHKKNHLSNLVFANKIEIYVQIYCS